MNQVFKKYFETIKNIYQYLFLFCLLNDQIFVKIYIVNIHILNSEFRNFFYPSRMNLKSIKYF